MGGLGTEQTPGAEQIDALQPQELDPVMREQIDAARKRTAVAGAELTRQFGLYQKPDPYLTGREQQLATTNQTIMDLLKKREKEPEYPWEQIQAVDEPRYIPRYDEHRAAYVAASALLVVAIAGPRAGRMGAGAAMNALAGALKGLHDGNKERFEIERDRYQEEIKKILMMYEGARKRYLAVERQKDLDLQQIVEQRNQIYNEIGVHKKDKEVLLNHLSAHYDRLARLEDNLIQKAWTELWKTQHPKAGGGGGLFADAGKTVPEPDADAPLTEWGKYAHKVHPDWPEDKLNAWLKDVHQKAIERKKSQKQKTPAKNVERGD
jgi:hypothetical protein